MIEKLKRYRGDGDVVKMINVKDEDDRCNHD